MKNKLNKRPYLKKYFSKKDNWSAFKKGRPENWTKDDRYKKWVKEQKEQGFASYDMWGLDHTMLLLLAERVMAFTPYLEDYTAATPEAQEQRIKDHKKLIKLLHEYLTNWDAGPELKKKIWVLWSDIQENYWYQVYRQGVNLDDK